MTAKLATLLIVSLSLGACASSSTVEIVATAETSSVQQVALVGADAPIALSVPHDVLTIQGRLRDLGYYSGPVNGRWGYDTQKAIERFQRAHGLKKGLVTEATLTAMGHDMTAFAPSQIPVYAAAGGDTGAGQTGSTALR